MSESRFAASPPQSRPALFAYGLLLTGASTAIALAGFAAQGNLGIFLLFAGAALIFCPPSAHVETRWWVGGGVLLACCACALLPARLLLPWPTWRLTLGSTADITLPATISPAPQVTVFWLVLLLLTMVIALFALAQPMRSASLFYFVLGAALICGIYAAASMFAKLVGWHPPLVDAVSFGPFPNRNHTATLFVTGSILSLSVLNMAFRSRRWIILDLALAALLCCVVALLFFSSSRGGVTFFFVGIALWLAGLIGHHANRQTFIVHAAFLLAACSLFLVVRNAARDRLLASVGFKAFAEVQPISTPQPVALTQIPDTTPPPPTSEFRTPIWRDTLKMIAAAPLTGTGLGTFAWVFPQYRQASLSLNRAVHPESDWLLLIAEAGLPAFICLVALGVGFTRRLVAGRAHPYWPLRWGCGAAALTALLHGAVDAPAHRVALGWWILVLAGFSLSLAQGKQGVETARQSPIRWRRWPWQRLVFVTAGVGSLALGGMLAAAEWFGGPDLPPFLVEQSPLKIFQLQNNKNFAAAEALARRVIRESPLFDQPYFQLGVAIASQSDDEGTNAKVDEVFRAQRLLDPLSPNLSTLQGDSWGGYDPVRQTAMYLDSLARRARIDRLEGRTPPQTLNYFGDLVVRVREQPDVQRYLLAAARPDGRLAQAWLTGAAPELAKEQADNIAEDAALIRSLSEADRQSLVSDWFTQKEQDQPQFLLPGGRGAAAGGWPVRLRQMVNAGHFEQAVGELSRRYGISLEVPQKSAGTDVANPTEETRTPLQKAWLDGDVATARRLLKEMPVKTDDPADAETLRWRAALAAHDADWSEAWLILERYVQHTRQTEWP